MVKIKKICTPFSELLDGDIQYRIIKFFVAKLLEGGIKVNLIDLTDSIEI